MTEILGWIGLSGLIIFGAIGLLWWFKNCYFAIRYGDATAGWLLVVFIIVILLTPLLMSCHPRFVDVDPEVGDIVEVQNGFYSDCKGEVTKVTESGAWIELIEECNGQEGEWFFTTSFLEIRRR